MKSITVRGIDDLLEQALEKTAAKEHKSLNKTIITLLKRTLGLEKPYQYPLYHDLDHLAGTWVKEDTEEFNRATDSFNKIDEELWK